MILSFDVKMRSVFLPGLSRASGSFDRIKKRHAVSLSVQIITFSVNKQGQHVPCCRVVTYRKRNRARVPSVNFMS